MTAALELTELRKSFGKTEIIRGVDLSIGRGERHAIIGPNGAGKSTLFNLITGNIAVDRGRVTYLDRDVTRMPPMGRTLAGIGRSFQIPQPFERLTVFENLLVAGAFGQDRSEQDVKGDHANVERGSVDIRDALPGFDRE